MNILQQLNNTKFLDNNEIDWLTSDILGEFDCSSARHCGDRRLIAWFLRNVAYLPYKKISDALGYFRAPQAYLADMKFANSAGMTFSISGVDKHKVDMMRSIADGYYDCSKNLYLDRVSNEYLEEALLYGACKACGIYDRKSNYNAGFDLKKSPTDSQLFNLKDLIHMYENNESINDFLDIFEITKNE